MNRLGIGICTVLITLFLFFQLFRLSISNFIETVVVESPPVSDNILRPQPDEKKEIPRVTYGLNTFGYLIIRAKASRISLIENRLHDDSETLAKKNHCSQYTNAGYYTSNQVPLGLFVEDGIELYPRHESATLNGFFWVTDDLQASIGTSVPLVSLRLALQSGPLLFLEGKPVLLTIANDRNKRRVTVGITVTGDVFYTVIFDTQSPYRGPLLQDLPSLVSEIIKKEQLIAHAVLNLDGGTASVFKTNVHNLGEFKTVGSIFCIL
jgi:uncharacterized protein YigE (DUF2233 family)